MSDEENEFSTIQRVNYILESIDKLEKEAYSLLNARDDYLEGVITDQQLIIAWNKFGYNTSGDVVD